MELNFATFVGIISFSIVVVIVIKIAVDQAEQEKKLNKLLEMYDNTLKLYFGNPQKYEKYRSEFLEWRNKVESAKDEYYVMGMVESLSSDMNTLEEHALKELISTLESFKKWKTGKIE